MSTSVDDRKFLNLIAPQQTQGRIGGDALLGGDQWRFGHHLRDPLAHVHFEAHVPIGDDAHQCAVVIDHGKSRDVEASAHAVDFGEGVIRRAGHRIGDHAGLGALDHLHLAGLFGDGQVAV